MTSIYCGKCRRAIPATAYVAHKRTHGSGGRSALHWRMRRQMLKEAGHQCQAIDAHGRRCFATSGLEMHHKDGNRDNNVRSNLVIVCFDHHPRG